MAVLSKTGITNSSIIQASHITQSIDALTGQVTDYDITISGSLTLTGSFRIANGTITSSGAISSSAGLFGTTLVTSGAITSSGAISSSAGLFGTTLVTSGAITSSGAISSSAGLFGTTVTTAGNVTIGGTLTTTGAITSSGAISSSAGLFSTTLRTTGAITASIISASSGITASSMLANNYRRATANLTFSLPSSSFIDASLTGSVTWIASFGNATYNISASMPQDGLSLDVYVQNSGANGPIFNFCGSTDGSTYFLVSGSNNAGVRRTSVSLNVSNGSVFIQFRRVGNNIIAGIC